MIRRLSISSLALVLLLGATIAAAATLPPGGSFTDDDGSVHEANIEAIAAEGITQGCNPPVNDLFCPDKAVTRAQMATFLTRALSLPAAAGSFTDTAGSVHEANIGALAAAGITVGCNPPTNDMFCPDKAVTRAQMATFLTRALGLTPIVPPPPTSSTTTTLVVPPGGAFSGPLQSQAGFTGEISFATSSGNNEVMNPMLMFVFDNYKCDGVTLSGGGQSTIFTTVPVVNGSFAYYGGALTWIGRFDSSTEASGTVAGTMLLGTSCDWGPVSWSAATP
jgi:hypothetical protein